MTLKQLIKYRLAPRLYHAVSTRRKVRRSMAGHEPELGLLPMLVDPKRIAVDVGANQGLYTWCLGRCADKVVAIEPQRVFADYLKEVAPSHVTVMHMALSDSEGEVELRVPTHAGRRAPNMATLQDVPADIEFETESVMCAPLDSLGLGPIGFIKIDVEGHELAVLEGARHSIARDRPVMLVEVNERGGPPNENEVVRFVTSMQYMALVIRRGALQHVSMVSDLKGGRNLLFFPVDSDRTSR